MRSVRFKQLSSSQQQKVARKMLTMFSNGARYEPIDGATATQRAPSIVEIGNHGEDSALSLYNRNRITNQARNEMRNDPIFRSVDQQRRVNVVGTDGGKIILNFPDAYEKQAEEWGNWFNSDWAPTAEFTDQMHLNDLIKNALSSCDISGDVILLFDDGLLADSGRIRAFESDECANLESEAFQRRFAKFGYTQNQGRIYDTFGRFCGVVVGNRSGRGNLSHKEGECFVLLLDPDKDRRDAIFAMPRRAWRFNQGRGVTPMTSGINTAQDIHETVSNEIQAAKLNAKMVGQILDQSDDNSGGENPVPSEFAPGEQPTPTATTEESADTVAADEAPAAIDTDALDAIGAVYDIMPPKLKMELFDTKRPNTNMPAFMDWLVGTFAGVWGFARPFGTLNPIQSYAGFKAAQALTFPSVEEEQKAQERYTLDWIGRSAFRWAMRKGIITPDVPANWAQLISWDWPLMREVNEVDAQNAINLGLSNFTKTFSDILGPKWKSKIQQAQREVKYLEDSGMVHPSKVTVSGAVVESTATKSDSTQGANNE